MLGGPTVSAASAPCERFDEAALGHVPEFEEIRESATLPSLEEFASRPDGHLLRRLHPEFQHPPAVRRVGAGPDREVSGLLEKVSNADKGRWFLGVGLCGIGKLAHQVRSVLT